MTRLETSNHGPMLVVGSTRVLFHGARAIAFIIDRQVACVRARHSRERTITPQVARRWVEQQTIGARVAETWHLAGDDFERSLAMAIESGALGVLVERAGHT